MKEEGEIPRDNNDSSDDDSNKEDSDEETISDVNYNQIIFTEISEVFSDAFLHS